MVQIRAETTVDAAQRPFAHRWDTARRQNYNTYEEKINENIYQHQRMANTRLPYRVFYPRFYQHYYLDLKLYKNLQALGEYFDEEVEEYKAINPGIKSDLRHTFKTSFPVYGLVAGLALQVVPIKFKLSLANNLAMLIAPMVMQWSYDRYNIGYKHNANQFLDWALQKRIAKAQLEHYKGSIDAEQAEAFKRNFPDSSPLEVFKNYINM